MLEIFFVYQVLWYSWFGNLLTNKKLIRLKVLNPDMICTAQKCDTLAIFWRVYYSPWMIYLLKIWHSINQGSCQWPNDMLLVKMFAKFILSILQNYKYLSISYISMNKKQHLFESTINLVWQVSFIKSLVMFTWQYTKPFSEYAQQYALINETSIEKFRNM